MTENPPLLRKPDLLPSLPNKSWGLQVKKKKKKETGGGGGIVRMCGPPCFFWLSWSSLLTGNCCLWARQRSVGGRYWVQTGGRSFVEHQTARCAGKELRAADVEGKKHKAQATEEKKWRMKKRCKNKRHWASPPLFVPNCSFSSLSGCYCSSFSVQGSEKRKAHHWALLSLQTIQAASFIRSSRLFPTTILYGEHPAHPSLSLLSLSSFSASLCLVGSTRSLFNSTPRERQKRIPPISWPSCSPSGITATLSFFFFFFWSTVRPPPMAWK